MEGVFEDSGAMPPYGLAYSIRSCLVDPAREGCHSTIELRFITIL